MGRPSLNNTPVLVRLPKTLIDQIDALAGKSRRAQFIRDALERAIAFRTDDLLAALKETQQPDYDPDYEITDIPSYEIRDPAARRAEERDRLNRQLDAISHYEAPDPSDEQNDR